MFHSPIQILAVSALACVTLVSCRGVTPGLREQVEASWATEDTAELCHHFYWPIADPSATKELKRMHYSIMQAELEKRDVDCQEKYPDNVMFGWENMLEKTLD